MITKRRNGFLDNLKMCSNNIFFTLGYFWVGLPQNLGFDFSVLPCCPAFTTGQITQTQTCDISFYKKDKRNVCYALMSAFNFFSLSAHCTLMGYVLFFLHKYAGF